MHTFLHCPSCHAALRVPKEAAGHRARCSACATQFLVPSEKEILEETFSHWIEQDVDALKEDDTPLGESVNQSSGIRAGAIGLASPAAPGPAVSQDAPPAEPEAPRHAEPMPPEPTASQAQALPREHAGTDHPKADEDQHRAERNLGRVFWPMRRAAQPARPHGMDEAGKVHAPEASTLNMSRPATTGPTTEPAGPYPRDLNLTEPAPHLVVSRCDHLGVLFMFDSAWLAHEGFRASMPQRCIFSGQGRRQQLMARPLIFGDRCRTKTQASEVAWQHEHRVLGDHTTRDLMRTMGQLENLSHPFNLAMPFYLSTDCAHLNLHCQTHDRTDGGITCELLIPDAGCAIEWLGRVNGVCGPEYRQLEHDVSMLHGEVWQSLGEESRQRITRWCKLRAREAMQLYLSDADFGRRDEGLAGIVVTDERLVFCKYHHRGEVPLDEPGASILAKCDARFANLTLLIGSDRSRMVKLNRDQLTRLIKALEGESKLKVSIVD